MKSVKFAFASVALLAILAAVFVVRARQSPSAQDIFKRMANTYATCHTYRDEGTFKEGTSKSGDKTSNLDRTSSGTFTTAFARPNQFRFHSTWNLKNRRTLNFVVWLQGKESRFWNGARQTDEAKEFSLSLARATGISFGATYNTTFLFPDGKYGPEFPDADAKRIADAKVEGEDCYCLEITQSLGHVSSPLVNKFYVSKVTFLLRKMETDLQINAPAVGKMTSHSEVIWKPVINEDIPASALEYNPPR